MQTTVTTETKLKTVPPELNRPQIYNALDPGIYEIHVDADPNDFEVVGSAPLFVICMGQGKGAVVVFENRTVVASSVEEIPDTTYALSRHGSVSVTFVQEF